MFASSLLLASLLTLACANPVVRNMIVQELRSEVPSGFVNSGPASADTTLNLRIGLVQGDMAGLEKALYDVSEPTSAHYGQHLSKDQVEAFVKPSTQSTSNVNEWLSSNGLTATTISPAGDWLSISVPVSKANELLNANFSVFTHQSTGTQAVRTLSYSIPATLEGHIDLIHPTTTFPSPSFRLPILSSPSKMSRRDVPSSCEYTTTPACLQALYGIPATPASQSANKLGVSGFVSEYANQADLTKFLTKFRPDLANTTTFSVQTIDNGTNPQVLSEAGVEANLDIQYTVGLASGVPTTFISVGSEYNDGSLEGFLDIINFLLGESAPPQVLSTSYGQNEANMSPALAINLCNAYMQLGARGTSIIFASGDGGVSGAQSGDCTTFLPAFPSGCPFMTSVGATTDINPETAAYFSAGGFSNYFAQPSYQSTAVAAYLKTLGSTNSGLFNKTGRGFPDVSAQGEDFELVIDNSYFSASGTSCASPTFASIISLLNDQLMAAGKPSLGFLNPFLYSAKGAASFTDITSGSNPGCNTNGFPATTGWDPVTGLGTPNFAKLQSALGL